MIREAGGVGREPHHGAAAVGKFWSAKPICPRATVFVAGGQKELIHGQSGGRSKCGSGCGWFITGGNRFSGALARFSGTG
jgi:hypothetical protein